MEVVGRPCDEADACVPSGDGLGHGRADASRRPRDNNDHTIEIHAPTVRRDATEVDRGGACSPSACVRDSPAWHASSDRRSAVERSFSWIKDKARLDLARGAIRVMGMAKHRLMRTIAWMVVNYKILCNFETWRAEPERRRRKPRRRKHFTEALLNIRPAATPPPRSNSPPES